MVMSSEGFMADGERKAEEDMEDAGCEINHEGWFELVLLIE